MEAVSRQKAQELNEAYEYISELIEINGSISLKRPSIASFKYDGFKTQHIYNNHYFTPGFPDPEVIEIFLKSSFIVSTGYNKRIRRLYIKIRNDYLFIYDDVPESVYNDFIAAESHGKFAHKYIFHCYKQVIGPRYSYQFLSERVTEC